MTSKASYQATILGYKDLWQTIADLQQGLRGSGQLVALKVEFLIQMMIKTTSMQGRPVQSANSKENFSHKVLTVGVINSSSLL